MLGEGTDTDARKVTKDTNNCLDYQQVSLHHDTMKALARFKYKF